MGEGVRRAIAAKLVFRPEIYSYELVVIYQKTYKGCN